MEDVWLSSTCNNSFEVSSLSRRCCPDLHSWTFWGGLALLSLLKHFHKVSVCYPLGKRTNNSAKKSFIWLFSVCFSSSVSETSKIFPTIAGSWRVFLTPSLNVYFLYFLFFPLKFWINKWMRAESIYSWNCCVCIEGLARRGPGRSSSWASRVRRRVCSRGTSLSPRPGVQTWEGGRGLPSSRRDRGSSNKQNHTDTWGGAQMWFWDLLQCPWMQHRIPTISLPASLEYWTSTPACFSSSFSGPPSIQQWLSEQEPHTSLSL